MPKDKWFGLRYAVTYKRPGYKGRVAFHKLLHTKAEARKLKNKLKKLNIGSNPRVKKVC